MREGLTLTSIIRDHHWHFKLVALKCHRGRDVLMSRTTPWPVGIRQAQLHYGLGWADDSDLKGHSGAD